MSAPSPPPGIAAMLVSPPPFPSRWLQAGISEIIYHEGKEPLGGDSSSGGGGGGIRRPESPSPDGFRWVGGRVGGWVSSLVV